MKNIFESINNTTDSASEIGEKYLNDTKEYFRLKIFQQLTISVSMIAKAIVVGGLLFIGLIFLAVSAALAIGLWLENVALGYVIVAGFFLLCSALIYVQRGAISKIVIAKMSPKFFNS